MVSFGTALQNFFFRTGNFTGRATRAEFWYAIPTIWLLVFVLFILDFLWVWDNLKLRTPPSLNPLTYSWFIIYALTFPSRFTLTVRRLHDSGRSGKWAFLPMGIFYSTVMLAFGIVMTYSTQSQDAQALLVVGAVGLSMWGSIANTLDPVWEILYIIAANYEGTEVLGAIFYAIMDGISYMSQVEVSENVKNGVSEAAGSDPTLLILVFAYIFAPFISALLYLFFMLAPSEDDNIYGGNTPQQNPFRQEDGRNPLEAYSALIEMERAKSPEEVAAKEAARKDEVRKLYEQRVLGRAT